MNSISIFSSPNPGHPFKEVMVTLKGGNLKMHKVKTGQVKLFLALNLTQKLIKIKIYGLQDYSYQYLDL